MAIDFPDSPTSNQIYTSGGRSWISTYTTTTTRTNLVTNPNFETNADFWGGGGGASTTLAKTTAQSYSGSGSLQCTATLAGNMRVYFTGTTGSTSGTNATRIPVTAGQTYTFSAYTRAATTPRSVDVLIEWWTSAGSIVSTSETTETTNSTTAWTRTLSLTATAPAGAVTCVPSVRIFSAAISEVHYIDAALFETGSTLLPYFDGTYADTYSGYTLTSQAWAGTADASTSTATWGLDSSLNWKAYTTTITSDLIANGTITSAMIANGTIVAADIASTTITNAQIASATITNANLANTTVTVGSTAISLGGSNTTIAGLTSITSANANVSTALTTKGVIEPITVSATAATGTINIDFLSNPGVYYTTNASANWTLNVRGNSSTTLNSVLATGDMASITFLAQQGGTAYYANVIQVDGSTVTPKWQGGTAPTGGNASSIDGYSLTILKTGNAAFTVFASQTKFA